MIDLEAEREAALRRLGLWREERQSDKTCQHCDAPIPFPRAAHPRVKYCSPECQRAVHDADGRHAARMALHRQRKRDGEPSVAERRAARDDKILAMKADGKTNVAIAAEMHLSRDTVSEIVNRRWPRSDYGSIRVVARHLEIALWRQAAKRKGVPLARVVREAANDISERVVRGIA